MTISQKLKEWFYNDILLMNMIHTNPSEFSYRKEETIRKEKVRKIRSQGIDPYPARVHRTKTIAVLLGKKKELQSQKRSFFTVGRIRSIRRHGGSAFLHLEDGTGKIQVYLKRDVLGIESYLFFEENIDIGDFIEIKGTLFTTHRGEMTILANHIRLITKTIAPLPEKWHGLVDTELRYRKRHLDLLANPEVGQIFHKRARIIQAIRDFLNSRGFLEVETPILQPIPGGANARPFETYHNVLKETLYLRVAPELYLKRLIVGGFERVYEIGRCFRNEGVDWSHNPEFTELEFYMAYEDYEGLMELTEQFFVSIVENVEKTMIIVYDNKKISLVPPFPRIPFKEAIRNVTGIDLDAVRNPEELYRIAKAKGTDVEPTMGRGKICDELFKHFVRPTLTDPAFITNHPVELSPLSKRIPTDSNYVERFQLYIAGLELTNAFSELNDPEDQWMRFQDQEKNRERGDEEAQRIDLDFVRALEHGMPPTAGFGMGIDRLVALLTNSRNLKETILFPTLKTEK